MEIIKTTVAHLEEIAQTLSAGDRAEFDAMGPGRDVKLVLLRSLGETSRTIVDSDGAVLACGGSRGCLWFVTSELVQHLNVASKIRFFKILKSHLDCVRKFSPPEELSNVVHVKNAAHISLLEHLGATFGYPFAGPTGERFRQFWL